MLQAILSKYLMNALLIGLVSIGYGFLKNKLGEDRASTIKRLSYLPCSGQKKSWG